MTTPIRKVQCVTSGCTLSLYDTHRTIGTFAGGKARLGYKFEDAHGAILFEGEDFGASPMHSIDSDASLLSLLGFLTLRHGDTDTDYFKDYTPAQEAWARSYECEALSCDVSVAEEVGGCACGYVWNNLDGWTCDDNIRGNVASFEVLDHGEDGSQYFPGCGTIPSKFAYVATGVGDTAREALEDALEQMATADPEARPSKLHEDTMVRSLDKPDKSALASFNLGPDDSDYSEAPDWHHYVSIRYNVREGT